MIMESFDTCCRRLSLSELQPKTKKKDLKNNPPKKNKEKSKELKMLFDVYGSHIAQPNLTIIVYSVSFRKTV